MLRRRIAAAALFAGIPLAANAATLSSVLLFGEPDYQYPLSPDSVKFCSQSGPSSATCMIDFHGGYYRSNGHAVGEASSSFGDVNGSVAAFTDRAYISSQFAAQFSDFVQVTGGTGAGTLVAHLLWSAYTPQAIPDFPPPGAWDCRLSSLPIIEHSPPTAPSFAAINGTSRQDWSGSSTGVPSELASPFVFGTLTPVGAFVSAASNCAAGQLTITSFSVYDGSGNRVTDAQVIPQGAPELNLFVPEPLTSTLLVTGLVALALSRRRRGKRGVSRA